MSGMAPRTSARSRQTKRAWWRRLTTPKALAICATSVAIVVLTAWALAPRAADTAPVASGPSDAPAASTAADPAPEASDPAPEAPHAVFIGDSYTVGVGSDGPDWPASVAEALGWTATNIAAGGTGYATAATFAGCGREHCGDYREQALSIDEGADIIIVAGGRNDPRDAIGPAAAELFAALRAAHPDAAIIALSPWFDDDALSAGFEARVTAVAEAATAAGITYIDTGQPFTGHPELISADGVHPNADGYAELSAALIPLLDEAI